MKHYIYILIDPDTEKVRYVGQTTNPVIRYNLHVTCFSGKSKRTEWLQSLRDRGLKPRMKIIDECEEGEWKTKERYWIQEIQSIGCDLVNSTYVKGVLYEPAKD